MEAGSYSSLDSEKPKAVTSAVLMEGEPQSDTTLYGHNNFYMGNDTSMVIHGNYTYDPTYKDHEEKAVSVSDPSAKYRKVQEDRSSRLDMIVSEIHNFGSNLAAVGPEVKSIPNVVSNNNNGCRVDKAPIWIDLTQPELNCSVCGTPLGSEDAEWHLIKCTLRLSVE